MRQEMMEFWDAVASAGPYANNLRLALDKYAPTPHHSIFYRPDAVPDAQPECQSTEGLFGPRHYKNISYPIHFQA